VRKSNHDVSKPSPARLRCAIYTRKSTEEGLDQEFNSLDAQREAAEAFIQSQRREGWIALPEPYDTAASPAPIWTAPLSGDCSRQSKRGTSIASWCTRSTA
jgi:hypothetical protein